MFLSRERPLTSTKSASGTADIRGVLKQEGVSSQVAAVAALILASAGGVVPKEWSSQGVGQGERAGAETWAEAEKQLKS